MKKIPAMFFVLSLFISVNAFSASAASEEQVTSDTGQSAQDFTRTAMAEFKSVDDSQLSYPEISSQIEKYARDFAKILLDSGINSNISAMILQNASVLYGQTLEALFNGKDYNMAIQEYSDKIADLFSQQHLGIETQSKIVDMSSGNLESMNSFFRDLEGERSPY